MADVTLVDEYDRVVGREEYLVARREGHLHRVACAIVMNAAGEVLLQRRSQQVHEAPGRWDVAIGGNVDPGMSYLETIEKEAQEELGLSDVAFEELGVYVSTTHQPGERVRRFVMVYLARYDGPIYPNPHEVVGARWFTVREVGEQIRRHPEQFAPELLNIFEKFMVGLDATRDKA